MMYSFLLRNTETGDSRLYQEDYDWDNEVSMLFQWFEHNYSCDCNRSLFLYDWEYEIECNSGDNVIVIDKIIRSDGSLVDLPEDN